MKFSEDGKEYIVYTPYTPARWLNYLTNGRYCAFIQPDGAGYSFWKDASYNGILNWSNCRENLNRLIYVKDGKDYWRVNIPEKNSEWVCRIGLDHQTIINKTRQIETVLTYFVPPDKDLEYWYLKIKNRSNQEKTLQIFAATELSLGNTLRAYISHEMNLYGKGWEEKGSLYATTTLWGKAGTMVENVHWSLKAFFTSTQKFVGFDCNKTSFVGDGRDSSNPIAVEKGQCCNSISRGRTPVFVLQFEIHLKPGEEKDMAIGLGVVKEKSFAPILKIEQVRKDRQKTKEFWEKICTQGVFVDTPDKNLNIAINYWNRKQALINFWWYRTAAAPHLIEGDMSGFRDATQPTVAVIPIKPQWAKEKILKLAGCQYKDGRWTHMFDFTTYKGPASNFSDVHLWLPMIIFRYLKETADFNILQKKTPFQDSGKASVAQHIKKTLNFMVKEKGVHNLSLLKGGDWNDGLNFAGKKGKGESIMVTQTLSYVLKEWALLNKKLNNYKEYRWALKEAKSLDNALNKYGWDGNWYVRVFTDEGKVIGSKKCKEGRIFLNAQSWAVISRSAPEDRAKKCMSSVERFLETPLGPVLLAPSYSRIDKKMGLITRCAPGEGENGSIFMHPIPWAITAFARIKSKKAYEYYKNSLFINVAKNNRYKAEPYVYPEIISGPESPHYGEGMRGWLTGCAAWFFQSCIEDILGIKPDYDGLVIDPCITPEWSEYTIKRTFRSRHLAITVKNPDSVHCGVKKIILNGKNLDSCFIPFNRLKKKNIVEVVMGKNPGGQEL